MSDELSHATETRRPGVDCVEVRLGDGQYWGLATPHPRVKPVLASDPDELGRMVPVVKVKGEVDYPLEIRQRVEEFERACRSGSAEQQHSAFFAMVSSLLRRVHDISEQQAMSLLEVELTHLPALVDCVIDIIRGVSLRITTQGGEHGR